MQQESKVANIEEQQHELDILQERMNGVRKLLQDSKWTEAATEMSDIRDKALIIYNDELALGMAEYYYLLGNVLVCKIENTQELFGQEVRDAEGQLLQHQDETDSEEEELNQALKVDDQGVDILKIESKQVEEKINADLDIQIPKEEVDGDIQLAWENLEIAKVILEKEHTRLLENQFADQIVRDKTTKHLARVHLRKAELEQWRDNFGVALEEHLRALELRLQVENHEKSRDIAESYFLTGNVHMYNYVTGCEVAAMKCYQKAIQILENNLSDELGLPRKDLSHIEDQPVTIIHLNSSFLDSEKITELKSIIKMLYEKIDDLKLALKESASEEYQKLQQEYRDSKNQQTQIFTQPQLPDKVVVNLGQYGNAAKRQVEKIDDVKDKQAEDKDKKDKDEETETLDKVPNTKIKRD